MNLIDFRLSSIHCTHTRDPNEENNTQKMRHMTIYINKIDRREYRHIRSKVPLNY